MPIYGRTTIAKIDKAVTDLEDFKAGNIRGFKVPNPKNYVPAFGYLPENWQEIFKMHREMYGIDYLIYSYGTPIAWKVSKGENGMMENVWIVPPVKYSQSSTGQQSAVTYALHYNGWKNFGNTSMWEK